MLTIVGGEEFHHWYRQARRLVEAGDRYVEADTFLIEAMAASLVGSPSDAGRLADGVVRLGRSIGSPRIAGLGLAAGARADLRQGNPSRAGRQLSAARRTLLTGGSHNEMLEVDFVDAGIHLDRGAWRRVRPPWPARHWSRLRSWPGTRGRTRRRHRRPARSRPRPSGPRPAAWPP